MKARPILFSGPMVRALLAGTKTQTRRICKPQPVDVVGSRRRRMYRDEDFKKSWCTVPGCLDGDGFVDCPYGQPGDRLWVRETWHACPHCPDGFVAFAAGGFKQHAGGVVASNHTCQEPLKPACAAHKWKPSIHMKRWMSRITLAITGIRVERLQDISEADAIAEGVERIGDGWRNYMPGMLGMAEEMEDPRWSFASLWESCYGPGSWDANPFVWVIDFKRVQP